MTKRVTAQKLSDLIADILEERILTGVYTASERLPSERQLAAEFGVSRPPLRDALHMLAARQLIVSRVGDGHYVSAHLQPDFADTWQSLLARHEYLRDDVLEFRRYLEGNLAALAAQRRTDADLERLEYWLKQMMQVEHQTDEASHTERQSAADVGFHQSIADAAHNILFARLSSNLLDMLHSHAEDNLANMFGVEDIKPRLIEQHQALYQAIKHSQPKLATELAYEHIDFVSSSLKVVAERQKRMQVATARVAQQQKRRSKR
ncbi:FadR/GntR family transcriptional regulator [Neisseriaceae bacterium ESL0693]|nr:FadR/GntR family transcriptional regulator [Neisseriaceae bacterium ESL0693]